MTSLHPSSPRTRARGLTAAALLCTLVAGAGLFSTAWASRQHAAIPTTPVVAWAGANSGIDEPHYAVASNLQEWAQIWTRHIGDRTDRDARGRPIFPEIDWDRFAVLAVFMGPMNRTNSVTLVSVTDAPDGSLTIARFDRKSFQTATLGSEVNTGPTVTPFGIFVVPRPAGAEIVFELNTQNIIGRPSVWTEKARLKGVPPLPGQP
jgi:hypothetical protein